MEDKPGSGFGPSHPLRWLPEFWELTRQRLLAAVREVLEESDYAAATVDGIASRAGTSRAPFRSNSVSPSAVCRSWMRRVTAGWETLMSPAAGVIPPASITARKASI